MRIILTMAFTALAGTALAQVQSTEEIQSAFARDNPNSYQKVMAGSDGMSLDETALSYFGEIVEQAVRHPSDDDPFNPRNFLRDRDGLSPAEIAEVVAVAERMNAPSTAKARQAAAEESAARKLAGCRALNQASTPDQMLALLEASEADMVKRAEQKGNAYLAELSPATRKHLLEVLAEYRKNITVGRQDWKKVRDVKPEAMEMYRAMACSNVN